MATIDEGIECGHFLNRSMDVLTRLS